MLHLRAGVPPYVSRTLQCIHIHKDYILKEIFEDVANNFTIPNRKKNTRKTTKWMKILSNYLEKKTF